MARDARSPFPGFDRMTPPYDPVRYPPPPSWPPAEDARTAECRHDWDNAWGQKGERQHHCTSCDRWIWERSVWPVEEVSA